MNDRVDQVLSEALKLPTEERSAVAVALLDSLGSDEAGVGQAWRDELRERMGRLKAGSVCGEPWPEVRARIARL